MIWHHVKYFKMIQKNKKAQLKIQEMTFMLLALVLFFIIAGLFFLMIQNRELYQSVNTLARENAVSSVISLSKTPEFSCKDYDSLCIDTDKLIVLRDREDYAGFWGSKITSIYVRKVFQIENRTEVYCNKNNYPDCTVFRVYDKNIKNKEELSTFVALCRKENYEGYLYDKCELGKIIVGTEIVQKA